MPLAPTLLAVRHSAVVQANRLQANYGGTYGERPFPLGKALSCLSSVLNQDMLHDLARADQSVQQSLLCSSADVEG